MVNLGNEELECHSHNAEAIQLKRSFISTVRPTVHTNPSIDGFSD